MIVFVFFKQKTAYEMRISDWSSDVCSSDRRTQAVYDTLDETAQISFFQLILHPILAGKTVVDLYTQTAINKLYHQQGRASTNHEIGSASCRERVCQYV